MQATSLFVMLLVAVASLSPNTSMPVASDLCEWSSLGIERFFDEDSYLTKVPPCTANVDKKMIYEYYSQYNGK